MKKLLRVVIVTTMLVGSLAQSGVVFAQEAQSSSASSEASVSNGNTVLTTTESSLEEPNSTVDSSAVVNTESTEQSTSQTESEPSSNVSEETEQTQESTQNIENNSNTLPMPEMTKFKTDKTYYQVVNAGYAYKKTIDGELLDSQLVLQKKFYSEVYYQISDGTKLIELKDNKHNLVGYVDQKALLELNNIFVNEDNAYGVVTVIKKDYDIWKTAELKEKVGKTNSLLNQKVGISKKATYVDGKVFYQIYPQKGEAIGYVDAEALKWYSNLGGNWISFKKYATINSKNANLWNNLNFTSVRSKSASIYQQTVQVKGKYNHFNGDTYFSLYDKNGKWLGYMNAKLVKQANARQGAYLSYGKYVTMNSNYTVWKNFSWTRKANKSSVYQKTFLAKGKYNHLNGATYYSLYDSKGNWYGYINAAGVIEANSKAGAWLPYYSTKKLHRNYGTWNDLNFTRIRNNANTLKGKIVQIKGKYNHYNGSTYYSVYSGKTWLGYINANGTTSPFTIYSQSSYYRYVFLKNGSGNFYSKPDPSSAKREAKKAYNNYMVRVTKQANTSDGKYYFVELPGRTLGWVKANQVRDTQGNFWMHTTGGRYPSLKVSNLNIQVSVSKQRVYLRSGNKVIYTMLCSTGLGIYPGNLSSPNGNFRIEAEKGLSFWYGGSGGAYYRSYKDHGVYLFHTVPIAFPGTTTHFNTIEGAKLGQRASHGCIRMSVADAKWFYYNMPYNTPVKIFW